MGGTMDFPRFRGRNGLTYRKPIGDPDPYQRNAREVFPKWMDDKELDKMYLLTGDLNRMEKDILGLGEFDPDQEIEKCEFGTGVDQHTARKVLRWFLGYPEPDCPECLVIQERLDFATQMYQRCPVHSGQKAWYLKRYGK